MTEDRQRGIAPEPIETKGLEVGQEWDVFSTYDAGGNIVERCDQIICDALSGGKFIGAGVGLCGGVRDHQHRYPSKEAAEWAAALLRRQNFGPFKCTVEVREVIRPAESINFKRLAWLLRDMAEKLPLTDVGRERYGELTGFAHQLDPIEPETP